MPVPNFPATHLATEATPLLPAVAPAPKRDTDDKAAYMHELGVLVGYSVPIGEQPADLSC